MGDELRRGRGVVGTFIEGRADREAEDRADEFGPNWLAEKGPNWRC